MATTVNEIKGYSLFNDVEDAVIQVYNRARTLKNIMLDYSDKDRNISRAGGIILLQYFSNIPEDDRQAVHTKLAELLKQKEVE